MTTWKLAVLVGAATAVGVTGVALAVDRDGRGDGDRAARTAVVAERNDNDGGPEEGSSGRQAPDLDQLGTLQELMQDPDFRDDLWALKDEATTAVRTWWDKYGDDPTSDDARAALGKLRDEQRAKLEALLDKYGVDVDDLGMMGRGGLLEGGLFGGPLGDGPPGDQGREGGGQDGPCAPQGTEPGDVATRSGSPTTTMVF